MNDEPRRKLIEVALPLEAINRESQHEKDVKVGKPTSVHHWWARRPLAASRAVLFASLVDDPSSRPEDFPSEEAQDQERQRLFGILEDLVKWESSNNEQILAAAREEIVKATGGEPPPVLDPFCGGGSIPLEAQRLGLPVQASELNPVAVLITKALVEIPSIFAAKPPVNPASDHRLGAWSRAQGLANDVRHYGNLLRDELARRTRDLYPPAQLPDGRELAVIAWLWARTVKCPNPACGAQMPLVRSFTLSTKKENEWHVELVIDAASRSVDFDVRLGPATSPGTVGRRGATCPICSTAVPFDYLRDEGQSGRIGARLMAIVAEGQRERVYLPGSPEHEEHALVDVPLDVPDTDLPKRALGFRVQGYGMTKHRQLFSARQLVALVTLSDLVPKIRDKVAADSDDPAYANAIAMYLGFVVDRVADWGNTLSRWENKAQVPQQVFGRQTLSMSWDFAEANPLSDSTGSVRASVNNVARSIDALPASTHRSATVVQLDAAHLTGEHGLVCTDPPYYDNVPYADLSDFFYVWLRRGVGRYFPDLFSTVLTPKAQELVADPHRFGDSSSAARTFFEKGMAQFFERAHESADTRWPTTLFYAFKQAESGDGAIASTGWETMLSGLVQSGFAVTGTWPMRTEMSSRMRAQNANALASSIVLVCRRRKSTAAIATRREFTSALRAELPAALKRLQHANIAPVDLAQAAIGPGMAIYSRYPRVVEAGGDSMTVRTALGLINHALDELLAAQEGDYDSDTRWCIAWFEQHGMNEGPFGVAETLSRAKNTAINGLAEAGVIYSRAGKVRLLDRTELEKTWDPVTDRRLTVWEITQYLISRHEKTGEQGASELLRQVGGFAEVVRELAYRLFSICERKGWAQEALAYNALVTAWPEISRLAAQSATETSSTQQSLEV